MVTDTKHWSLQRVPSGLCISEVADRFRAQIGSEPRLQQINNITQSCYKQCLWPEAKYEHFSPISNDLKTLLLTKRVGLL